MGKNPDLICKFARSFFAQAPANRPHAEEESSSEQDGGWAMADQQEGDPQAIAENPFRLVVVAASAGGIAALNRRAFPPPSPSCSTER